VKKTEDRKELAKALAALKEDNGFPHLQEAVEKRLAELDPAFKRKLESQNVSAATMSEISQDISEFLDDIRKMD
jgi:chorismate mutase